MYGSDGPLHELIYASFATAETMEDAGAVGDIVQVSIRNNAHRDVTGLLLVHDSWFLQVLEGPQEAVLTTYGRICNDTRHWSPMILRAGPIDHRAFGDWYMCARSISAADAAILETLSPRLPFNPQQLTGAQAHLLLKTVRGVQENVRLRAGSTRGAPEVRDDVSARGDNHFRTSAMGG